jgi:hypothetical protein
MPASANMFPHLDHFLNTYMHQDWDLFGPDLEGVIETYVKDTSSEDVAAMRDEITGFLASHRDREEPTYQRLFPNSVLPSGWQMTTREWLLHVAKLALDRSRMGEPA